MFSLSATAPTTPALLILSEKKIPFHSGNVFGSSLLVLLLALFFVVRGFFLVYVSACFQ